MHMSRTARGIHTPVKGEKMRWNSVRSSSCTATALNHSREYTFPRVLDQGYMAHERTSVEGHVPDRIGKSVSQRANHGHEYTLGMSLGVVMMIVLGEWLDSTMNMDEINSRGDIESPRDSEQ